MAGRKKSLQIRREKLKLCLFADNMILSIENPKEYTHTHKLIRPNVGDQRGFPGGSDGKESACIAGDQGSIPGLG